MSRENSDQLEQIFYFSAHRRNAVSSHTAHAALLRVIRVARFARLFLSQMPRVRLFTGARVVTLLMGTFLSTIYLPM